MTYDPEMRERVEAWKCDECGGKFYREGDGEEVGFLGVARRLRGWASRR
ncbi:MAG: hypothetical protein R3324_07575 [Halobacteriales archaeon]|nr:hypothetical protein [Halobacteriales archaeon]